MPGILSIGIYEGSDEFLDDAIAVNANMVFLHDQALRLAAGIKQRLPNIKIVGRPWLGSTEEQMDIINAANGRQWLHDHIAGLIGLYPQVDIWQLFNEVFSMGDVDNNVPPDFAGLRRIMEVERGGCDACYEHGKLAAIFNGGPGTIPTLEPGDKSLQRWGRAGYWDPWIKEMLPMWQYPGFGYHGQHTYANHFPDRFRDGAEWFVCRPLLFIKSLRAEGILVPPMALTEFAHGDDWKRFINEDEVVDDYTWFAGQMLSELQIKALFQFCDGDSGGWSEYSIHGTSIIARMGAWNAAHPVPWTEPEQGEEEMPIDQAKIDQLLAQNALITDALIALREGRLTGADGVDGYIAALRGGQVPAGYKPVGPSYPPK